MDINQLKSIGLNPAVAYIVGLCYPLYKSIELNGIIYVVGCVNHNANMINQSDLAAHYQAVLQLFNNNFVNRQIKILSNQNSKKNISPKKGFSILIETGVNSDSQCLSIFKEIATNINSADMNIKKEFAKGCFDGRSSLDTTAHYLSIDVDRDYHRQDLIKQIIESCGIEININKREQNHKKNDQIRIKKNSVLDFINNVGLYSKCRLNLIKKDLGII